MSFFITDQLLEEAVLELHGWYRSVKRQTSRHVYSFLPVKIKGAMPGTKLEYKESDDNAFLERFFDYRQGEEPFFDPFTREWLKKGYAHSNISTNRKGTFALSWGACEWEDSRWLTLDVTYQDKIRDQVLKKGGDIVRLPALPLAVWFYKRPSIEWPGRPDLHAGVPDEPADLIKLFRQDFHFTSDPAWAVIFDTRSDVLKSYPSPVSGASGTNS